jgi:7-dehydrocholesterol reductase
VTKFFMWETGYWNSMDIMHDRAGYYLCWGCMCWVPCVYTSPVLYLATHPVVLGPVVSLAIGVAGVACVYINYDSDRQRQVSA